MSLLHPWVLLLLPLPWICHRFCARIIPAELFSDPTLLRRSTRSSLLSARRFRWIIYALTLLALADPVTRHGILLSRHPAYRIALLLDDSRSMEEDNRFAQAKAALGRFIRSRPHDRLALGIFADYATVASPLTSDHRGILEILKHLKTGMAGGRETALYEALWRGADLLEHDGKRRGFIVLITDGLDTLHTLPLSAVLDRLKTHSIRVYTIGVGDDYRREIVERIARETGGAFFAAADPRALQKILMQIDRQEKSPVVSRHVTRYTHYTVEILVPALLLLLWLLWRTRYEPTEALRSALALLLLGGGVYAMSRISPADPRKHPALPPLYIALDLSRSMDAADCPPSRLRRAILDARDILKALPSTLPVALLGFSRRVYLIAPPGSDHAGLDLLLRHLDPDSIDREGSDFHALIAHLAHTPKARGGEKSTALILSDGGESTNYNALAALTRRGHLRLYGLALATPTGAPIPGAGGMLRDATGRIVLSRRNPAFARLIEQSGGTLLACPASQATLRRFAASIARSMGATEREYRRPEGPGRLLLWLAALLIFLPIPQRRRR